MASTALFAFKVLMSATLRLIIRMDPNRRIHFTSHTRSFAFRGFGVALI
jgi:hypothetical protein